LQASYNDNFINILFSLIIHSYLLFYTLINFDLDYSKSIVCLYLKINIFLLILLIKASKLSNVKFSFSLEIFNYSFLVVECS
jgi:hypothetical protein